MRNHKLYSSTKFLTQHLFGVNLYELQRMGIYLSKVHEILAMLWEYI